MIQSLSGLLQCALHLRCADGGWVGGRGLESLVPVPGISIAEALSNSDELVTKALDIGNRPRGQLGHSALVGIVHQLHVVGALGLGVDDIGDISLFQASELGVREFVGGVVVIDISVSGGNVPSGNDVAQAGQRRLDLDIVSATRGEGSVTKRRAHVAGDDSDELQEGLFDTTHLGDDLGRGLSGQCDVRPGVGGDLMARVVGTTDGCANGRVVDASVIVSINKEGDLDLLTVQGVKELVGVG